MTADIRKNDYHAISSVCLICSSQMKVSKRNCFGIFDEHVTETSGSPLYVVIGKVLNLEISEDSVHSSVVCKVCLKILNEVDEMEVKLEVLKKKLNSSYRESIKMLNVISINPPVESSITELSPTARKGIKCEMVELENNGDNISDNVQQEENVAEEGEKLEDYRGQIKKTDSVPDGICDNNVQAAYSGTNGECSDYMEEMEDEPDYVPNAVVDTDMKPFVTPRKRMVRNTSKGKTSLPEKLVEREDSLFVCLLCNGEHKIMGDRKGIVRHLKDIHGIRVYICDLCLQYFQKRSDLSEHLDSHVATEDGEFQCEVCNEVFDNIRLFEVHKRVHNSSEKMWVCDLCGKGFNSRNLLVEHVNAHIGRRPYVCDVCGKAFTSKYTHQTHKKTHEDRERNFKCNKCDKAFYRATSLKQHERTHAGTRNFVCDQCGKAFITARYLEVHSIVHTGYKPFPCRMCGKHFARRAEMINHERTHTGEKPYQCEFCGATFSQRSNLQSHKRATHYQDKRYKCKLCNKGFKRQRLLDYHEKAVHTGERPFKCEVCNAAFIYPHHFKKHSRMHMEKV